MEKMSKFYTPQKWENIYQIEVHIFHIIMQSFNIKEWKLLELQITQTRHHLISIWDRIRSSFHLVKWSRSGYAILVEGIMMKINISVK